MTVLECPGCQRVRKIHARGLCGTCYDRRYRPERGHRLSLTSRQSPNWSSERIAALQELTQDGNLRMKQIADRLGVTKNAIIGKLDRLRDKDSEYEGPTTMDRLQALHDRLDAVLAEFKSVRMYLPQKKKEPPSDFRSAP